MFSLELLRSLGERALSAALVVLVGALGGDAVNLFQLDWAQIGVAAVGAAVLEFLRGWLASTGAVGDKGSPSLLKARAAVQPEAVVVEHKDERCADCE